MRACFDAVTVNSARILGLDGYGVDVGCHADFVLLQARDPVEAIRLRAKRLLVVRRGRVVARMRAGARAALPARPPAAAWTGPCIAEAPPRASRLSPKGRSPSRRRVASIESIANRDGCTMTMKLIGSLNSPYVRKVRIVMAEKKLDYQFVQEDVWASDAIVKSNPLGKVPCLEMEGGEAVFDSRVIVEYLDTLSPVGTPDPRSRPRAHRGAHLGGAR